MPNWVYNYIEIEGSKEDISAIKEQLNKPFTRVHDSWNMETKQMELKEVTYSNPVFAFWNIIKPDNIEAYNKQPEHKPNSPLDFSGDDWYNWNVRNWGTKWDVAVADNEQYPDTELLDTEDWSDRLGYKFNTAWSPPTEALAELSAQYPKVVITHSFEEETGWGGEATIQDGSYEEIESYENKCRDCDEINTMEYCENDCGEICSSCNYLGEADMDCVAECEVHRELANSN